MVKLPLLEPYVRQSLLGRHGGGNPPRQLAFILAEMNNRYVEQVLEDGEKLLAELEAKERERAERRHRQKHVMYTDERGNRCSLLVSKR